MRILAVLIAACSTALGGCYMTTERIFGEAGELLQLKPGVYSCTGQDQPMDVVVSYVKHDEGHQYSFKEAAPFASPGEANDWRWLMGTRGFHRQTESLYATTYKLFDDNPSGNFMTQIALIREDSIVYHAYARERGMHKVERAIALLNDVIEESNGRQDELVKLEGELSDLQTFVREVARRMVRNVDGEDVVEMGRCDLKYVEYNK